MANNSIDLIVGKEAILGLENLISKLTIADDLILKTSQSALALSKSTSTISSTGGLTNNTAQNASQNADMQKYIKTVEQLEKKIISLTAAKKNNQEASLQDKVDARIALQNATAEAKAVSTKIDAYTRLDLAHKKAMQSAKNIGTTYGSTSLEFKKAAERANKLDAELKAIDETLGKNNRNVGNYKSGWNGLGNSINQLTREMPAFAVSANTGFLALSNNIPILVDEISRLKAANVELAKSGEPTKSVFKAIAGAFFSWGTVLSVGVTVLTLYGGKLVDMIKNLGDANTVMDKLIASQSKLDKSFSDVTATILHNAQLQIDKAKLRNASQKEQDTIWLNAQKEVLRQLEVAEDTSAEKKYQAAKKYRTAIANESTIIINQYSSREDIIKKRKEQADISALEKQGKVSDEQFKILEDTHIKRKNAIIEQGLLISELTSSQQVSQYELDKKNNGKERVKNEFEGDIAVLENKKVIAKSKLELFKGEVKEKMALSMNLASREIDLAEKVYQYNVFLAEKDKGLLLKANAEKSSAITTAFKENIERSGKYYSDVFKKMDDSLPKTIFGDKYKMTDEQKKQLKEHEDKVKKAADEMKNYLRSFVDEFSGNSGFEGVLHLFDGENSLFSRMKDGMAFTKDSWKSDTVAMMEGVQEMYNFISDASKANFEGEYNRLEEQKKTALKFAGESASAKEKIEADYEKKRKEIANRENKAKKKQAIFNIAIDTAQGIISALASTPPNVPLSVAIGVLGALQIATVASQKIPQYFEGGTHKGGMMLVNDAKGSNYQETIVTPDGKIMQPTERNVLMDAPSGTQIFTPEQWHEKQLFEMMQGKGIAMTNNYAKSNGLTYEQMDAVIGKHFANITTQTNVFDRNGFSSYSSKQGNITIRNNNRSQGIGFSV